MYGARSACNVILVDSNSWLLLVARRVRRTVRRRPLDYYGPLMINGCMWEHASMIILALCESHSEGNRKPVPNTTTKTSNGTHHVQFPPISYGRTWPFVISHDAFFEKWPNCFSRPTNFPFTVCTYKCIRHANGLLMSSNVSDRLFNDFVHLI